MAPPIVLDEQFAHSDGLARVCASADGSYLYSGGSDGLIRVFNAATESRTEDATVIDIFNDTSITSLDCSFDSLVVGTDDGRVALLDPSSGELKSLITRADIGHSIRCVRFGCSGKKIAVASDDLVVKVIDVRDTSKIQLLAGHTRAVRSVSWSPDGSILTTSGSDGILRIWDMSSSDLEPLCLKQLDGIVPTSKSSDTLDHAAVWHPGGQYFAVTNRTHEIVIISRSDWSQSGSFTTTDNNHNCTVVALAWSPNGNYLASAGQNGSVLIWETSTKSSILNAQTDGQLCDLAWQSGPGANTVALTDMRGAFLRWFDVVPTSRPHPTDSAPFAAVRQASVAPSVTAAAPPRQRQRQRSEQTAKAGGNNLDDLFGADLEDDDDWIVDDTGDGYKASSKDDLPPPLFPAGKYGSLPTASSKGKLPLGLGSLGGPSSQRGQDAFQPGATPAREKRRYLAFNHIGVIHTLERDGYNAVTVDFHDRGAHRSSHFEDPNLYNLAALSERGALYGTTTDGGVISYRAHEDGWGDSAGAQSGWSATLPKGEKATNLSLGTRCALVGTDLGYLRFFSAGGIQTHLIDLGRDILAVAVGDEWAFVVHRAASAVIDDRQDLSYSIYDIDTFEVVQDGPVPLPKSTQLQWIGFSEDQIPLLYKSNGVLSILDRARRPRQARWVPALDTNTLERREGKQERYWPVHVSSAHLHCVILKGEERHPYFPTPLLQDIDLKVPGCELDTAKGQLEEEYLRTGLMLGNQRDGAAADDDEAQASINAAELELDKLLLRQIQSACKADRLGQALELVKLLNRTTSIDAAAKIASFFHAAGLEERIVALRDQGDPGAMQPMKRAPKWQHLVDDSTMPQPRRAGSGSASNGGRQIDPFSRPFGVASAAAAPSRAQSRMQSTPAPRAQAQQQRRQASRPMVNDDSGLGSSDGPMELDGEDGVDETFDEAQRVYHDEPEPMDAEDDDDAEPLDFGLDEDATMEIDSHLPPAPLPMTASKPVAPANPFKKSLSAKTNGNATSASGISARGADHTGGLKKSGSFFDRVEGTSTAASKGKGKKNAANDGSKQSTLFGIAPPKPAADAEGGGKKKRGGGGSKKRKTAESQAAESQEQVEPAPKVDMLKAAFAKAANKPKKQPVVTQIADSDDEEFGETQVVDQPNKRQRLATVEEDAEFDAAMAALGQPVASVEA